MVSPNPKNLRFISDFVDAVTVRPFLSDLHRVARRAEVFRPLPREPDVDRRDDATAA
jgi:hypothetical protein